MEDAKSYTKNQQLEQNQANTSKFYTHFLYKALIITIFLVILPLFPSQAPEFINQTLLNRSWELLHLLFVGIAVSYGLFSRRNEETEKENHSSKFDNAQSYVSRFLQVSSVFDDETENLSGSDENKVQTWSNQYCRNEPMRVVARENSVIEEQRVTTSRIGEKPLLLPVRSLKSRVLDADSETSKEFSVMSGSLSRSSSNSGSKRFSCNSNKAKNGELGDVDHVHLEEKLNESVVLPSPIPWRSRSGRMEMKEDTDSPPLYTLPPSMEESEFNRLESRSFRSQTSRSSRPNSTNSSPKLSPSPSLSSPKKVSSSPSLSTESQAKSGEDLLRRKSFYRSSIPPPPPPPPPPMIRRSLSMKPSPSFSDDGVVVEDWNRSGGESQVKPRDYVADGLSMGKSAGTTRSSDLLNGAWRDREIEDGTNGKLEKRSKEVEVNSIEKAGRKMVGLDQSSFKIERPNRENVAFMPKETFMEFPKEEFVDKVFVETENEDSETDDDNDDADDDDNIVGSSFVSNVGGNSFVSGSSSNEEAPSSSVSDGGPDVDKKADEFIAKFREQIRLQRIDSIKRSTAQISRNSSR